MLFRSITVSNSTAHVSAELGVPTWVIKPKNHSVFPIYSVRFHVYPNTKIVKTKGGNSILISLSNGEGWLLESKTNDLEIEKNVFLGNKYKIINSESILISGAASEKITSIEWTIERAA